jgi:hypothetical protein
VLAGEITQGSCQQHPCARGSKCTYANLSSTCQPCQENTYSDGGITCELCPPGLHPSLDQAHCEPCGGLENPRAYSPFGVCLDCHGENVVSEDRARYVQSHAKLLAHSHTLLIFHFDLLHSCLPCPLGLGPANAKYTVSLQICFLQQYLYIRIHHALY